MDLFVFLVLPLMMFDFGFFPIAMACRGGKCDLVTSLKFGIIPGLFGFVLTYYFFSVANNAVLSTLTINAPLYALEVVAFILGMASSAFTAVGITGFTFKPEAAPVTAYCVNFVGVILVLLGLFTMYWETQMPAAFMYQFIIAGLMVLLFGVACLAAGYQVLGKLKGGNIILGIVIINFILSFVLLVYTF